MRDLLIWSAIFVLFWILLAWCQWRFWVWVEEQEEER